MVGPKSDDTEECHIERKLHPDAHPAGHGLAASVAATGVTGAAMTTHIENSTAQAEPPLDGPPTPGAASPRRPALVLAFLSVTSFALLLADTAVAVGLAQIGRGLGVDLAGTQWIVNAYTLAFAAIVLVAGSLTDVLGARRLLNTGLIVFAAASLMAALSPGFSVLVAARILQGIGAALVTPASLSVVIRAFPPPRQALALGVWAGVSTIALGVGPVVGALVTEGLSWRWLFLLNVPVAGFALAASLVLLAKEKASSVRHFDLAGAAASALGLVLVLFALSNIGASVGSPLATLTTLIAGLLLLCAFVLIERRVPAPLLDLSIFGRSNIAAGNALALLSTMLMCGILVFMSLYLQDVFRHSPLATGAALLALTFPLVIVAPVIGKLMRFFGRRLLIVAGLVVLTVGLAGLSVATRAENMGMLLAFLLVAGVGSGLSITPITSISVEAVEPPQAGLASGLLNTSRTVGLALGVAAMGAFLNAGVSSIGQSSARFASGLSNGFLAYAVLSGVTAIVALLAVTAGKTPPATGPGTVDFGDDERRSSPVQR